MAVTYETFLERFPQFKPQGTTEQKAVTEAMIRAEITFASRQVNPTYWGDQADDGIGLLAAHRVAKNPGGVFARLVNKDGSTAYLDEYQRLQRQLLVGDRVV